MIILSITLLGLFLRLVLANQSLWLDEAASTVIASLPLNGLIESLKGDFHPPLYYLLLKPWLGLAGQNEMILRLPGIIIGTLTIPALFLLVKTIFVAKKPPKFGLAHLSALILALNPLHIYYSQELRMYSLSALLATLSWYFLYKWLSHKGKSDKNLLYFVFITILSFYTFYLSIFILISQWIYVVFYHRQRLGKFIAFHVLFLISLVPWLSTFSSQLQGGGYLTKALPQWSALSGQLSLKSLVLIPIKFSLGRISILPKSLYYLVVVLVSSFIALISLLSLRVKRSRIFFFWLLIPLVLGSLVSLFTPILGYWRYIFLLPAFSTVLAIGIASLPKKNFIINLVLIIVLSLSANFIFLLNPRFHRESWSTLSQIITKSNSPLILVNFPDAFAPIKFYFPDTPVFPTQVSLGKKRPDIDQALPPLISPETTIIYLDYLSDLTDPDRSILIWLDQAGLQRKKTYQLNGLGVIHEYQTP
jgi:uncharacterized membrane protein